MPASLANCFLVAVSGFVQTIFEGYAFGSGCKQSRLALLLSAECHSQCCSRKERTWNLQEQQYGSEPRLQILSRVILGGAWAHRSQPWTQEYLPKEARQHLTSTTRPQSNILFQALDWNGFPDIATRKILAKQTGIRESRIQNRQSLYPGQREVSL